MSIGVGLAGVAVLGVVAALAVWGRGSRLSGEYDEVGGPGKLEFRGAKVYVAAPLGVTLVAAYEVDGDRVIIRGGGGAQVYMRRGDTLDAGMGVRFVKKSAAQAAAGTRE